MAVCDVSWDNVGGEALEKQARDHFVSLLGNDRPVFSCVIFHSFTLGTSGRSQ